MHATWVHNLSVVRIIVGSSELLEHLTGIRRQDLDRVLRSRRKPPKHFVRGVEAAFGLAEGTLDSPLALGPSAAELERGRERSKWLAAKIGEAIPDLRGAKLCNVGFKNLHRLMGGSEYVSPFLLRYLARQLKGRLPSALAEMPIDECDRALALFSAKAIRPKSADAYRRQRRDRTTRYRSLHPDCPDIRQRGDVAAARALFDTGVLTPLNQKHVRWMRSVVRSCAEREAAAKNIPLAMTETLGAKRELEQAEWLAERRAADIRERGSAMREQGYDESMHRLLEDMRRANGSVGQLQVEDLPLPHGIDVVLQGGDARGYRLVVPGCGMLLLNRAQRLEVEELLRRILSRMPHQYAPYLVGQSNAGCILRVRHEAGRYTHTFFVAGPRNEIQRMTLDGLMPQIRRALAQPARRGRDDSSVAVAA